MIQYQVPKLINELPDMKNIQIKRRMKRKIQEYVLQNNNDKIYNHQKIQKKILGIYENQ